MAMEKGSAFLLKVGDGAATPAYATVAGLRTTQLSINGEAVVVTNKGSGGWRELLSGAGVRVDTAGLAWDCGKVKVLLEDGLGKEGARVGRLLEDGLVRAVRTGRLGFEDLKRMALSALAEIAAASIRGGIGSLTGGGPAKGAGLFDLGKVVIANTLGLPGRATGGPVAGGRPYLVGERGPEMFVPTAAGRIETLMPGRPSRDVRVAIRIEAGGGAEPQALARSGRQVARAVRRALDAAER